LQKKLGEILIELAQNENPKINFPRAEYELIAEADKEEVIKETKEKIKEYLKNYRELLDRNKEEDKKIIKTINFVLGKDNLKAYRGGVNNIKKINPSLNIRQLEDYVAK